MNCIIGKIKLSLIGSNGGISLGFLWISEIVALAERWQFAICVPTAAGGA
jgi:hypothetical protein